MVKRLVTALVTVSVTIALLFQYEAKPQTYIMLDVGQGLSELYTDSTGWQLLYDGGPDSTVISQLGQVMPVWDNTIDVIVVSHPHADHTVGVIKVLQRYTVKELWLSDPNNPDQNTQQIIDLAQKNGVTVKSIARGWQYITPGQTVINVLTPDKVWDDTPPRAHAATPVIVINPPNQAALMFTGDLDSTDESELLAWCIDRLICPSTVGILQVSHHGSRETTSAEFLARFNPVTAVIGVGQNNRYQHPHTETITRLQEKNITIKRTDQDQTIVLKP